ncbi:PREDICTED: von Willebrand factor D and EGF domain-containing protein-like isoform X2 [Branchiostoma belcheri]|uniref:von Willebrand factor D and EGF domain-containing protein-like isoform X2 n=1 Tax=Branchiostoma belcheri TaxID=7741 RepID=A0A6P4YXL2_BRABE|nr:PREDICTED: von Willebrand factor D and EGF domain-containing protein-like isoform X2 [Branchiostoma belcheri]
MWQRSRFKVTMLSFLIFTAGILVVMGTTDDPCLTAKEIYEPRRSTEYVTPQHSSNKTSDTYRPEGWYRFTHMNGMMPTVCVEAFRCGTDTPIWMDGTHPAVGDGEVDRVACSNLGFPGDCCPSTYNIKVKACGPAGNPFYVYRLVPTIYHDAYCAGNTAPCPDGLEYNVFHDRCGPVIPAITEIPVLHPPEVRNNTVEFDCEVKYPEDPLAQFEVAFLFDNEYFSEVPNKTLTAGQRRATLDAKYLGEYKIGVDQQKHWDSKMGKDVSCIVRSFWESTPSIKSAWSQSGSYFAGIQAETHRVVVDEAQMTFELEVTNSVPFVCRPNSAHCFIDIPFAFNENAGDIAAGDACGLRLTKSEWSRGNITMVAVKDGQQDGNKQMYINFGVLRISPLGLSNPHIFNGYKPDFDIQVQTIDTVEATCTSSGDPHIVMFDSVSGAWNKQAHVILPGEFVFYRSTAADRTFEVQSRHKRCSGEISCNCGVAVREGNDAVIIDKCHNIYGAASVRYLTANDNGELSPGFIVERDGNGKQFKVIMPSGAFVEATGSSWMTISAHAPGVDKGHTEGICGFFDGDPDNDLRMPDGTTASHHIWPDWHRDFSHAWRITPGTSLFDVDCLEEVGNGIAGVRFCECPTGGNALCDFTKTRRVSSRYRPFAPPQSARNRNCHRRRRNVKNIEDDPLLYNDDVDLTDYVFDYGEGSNPVVNSVWPTPNKGITEQDARSACQGAIMNLTIAQSCRDIYNVDIFSGVDFCMADIKVTEEFDYVDIIVQQIQADCAEKAYKEVSLYETNEDGTAVPPTFITANLCPRQCSNNGQCVNGTCKCNEAYVSEDCSIQVGRPPVALALPAEGLCDVRTRPCMKTSFFAEGLMDSENLTCRVTHVKIEDGQKIPETSSGRSGAEFRSFGEVACILPRSPVRYGTPATNEGAVAHGMLVSVSNDGERFSGELFFTVYDSVCQECTEGGDCLWKQNTCNIRGHCFGDEEPDPNNWCLQCLPQFSNTTWSNRQNNSPPSFTTSSTITKLPDENLTMALSAVDPEGRPLTFSLVTSGDPGVTVKPDGMLTWIGDFTTTFDISITVQDECGSSAEQTFQLTTTTCDCQNGGLCVPDPDEPRGQGYYSCVCPGYTGQLCETEIDECQSNPCSNGTCIDYVNGYNCTCAEGYIGINCDVSVNNKCALEPCFPGVSCVNLQDGGYQCGRCPPGFLGNGFECEDINECDLINHGCPHLCENLPGTYECTCPEGLSPVGDLCTDLDECKLELDDCSHICTNTNGSYTCGCPPGYVLGTDARACEEVNECTSSPCQHGGRCQDDVNQYSCSCTHGWTGSHCQDDVDECYLINHGCEYQCQNTPGSYVCVCPEGYTLDDDGKSCEGPDATTSHPEAITSSEPYRLETTVSQGWNTPLPEKPDSTDVTALKPEVTSTFLTTTRLHSEHHTEGINGDDCRSNSCPDEVNQDCVEVEGSFVCKCVPGYYVLEDGKECKESMTLNAEVTISHIGTNEAVFTENGLGDPESEEFSTTAVAVETAINEILTTSDVENQYKGCKVTGFRSGSVIVLFGIHLSGEATVSASEIRDIMYAAIQLNNNTLGSGGSMLVIPASIQVSEAIPNEDTPWYRNPLYLVLLCVGLATVVTVGLVAVFIWFAGRKNRSCAPEPQFGDINLLHFELAAQKPSDKLYK